MNSVQRAVSTYFGFSPEIEQMYFYQSKKNQVTRLVISAGGMRHQMIAKCFIWGSAAHEAQMLKACEKQCVPAPRLLLRCRNVLLMEYLPGSCLSTALLEEPSMMKSFICWTAAYHDAMKRKNLTMVKGDMRLHNFVVSDGVVMGIDFEEARRGEREWDIADICASLIEGHGTHEARCSALSRFITGYEAHCLLQRETLKECLKATLQNRALYNIRSCGVHEQWLAALESPGFDLRNLSPALQ